MRDLVAKATRPALKPTEVYDEQIQLLEKSVGARIPPKKRGGPCGDCVKLLLPPPQQC
jgi:hypothetical protein